MKSVKPLCAVMIALGVVSAPVAADPPRRGSQYAVLVGVGEYDRTELKALPYTGHDVSEFHKVLIESGYEADNIKLLTDQAAQTRYRPLRANIMKELALTLKGLKTEDSVVVALSGHGVHFRGDKIGYFCPSDAKLADKSSMIPMEGEGGLFEVIKACKAKRKLLLVNACRNDPASDLAQASRKVNLDDEETDRVPEGIAALYSCQQGEKSYFDPDRKMGLFFLHLCKAWRGEYLNGDNELTLDELFAQVTKGTKRDADKTFGAAQIPVVKREFEGSWVVSNPKRRVATMPDEAKAALALIAKGRDAYERHAYDDAIRHLSDAIKQDRSRSEAFELRAFSRLWSGPSEEALSDAREAVRLNPASGQAYAARALALVRFDNLRPAHEDAIVGARLDPKSYLCRVVLSEILGLQQDWERAFEEANAALAIKGGVAHGHRVRGLLFGFKGDWDGAVREATKAIENDPAFALAYGNRAWAYAEKQMNEQSVRDASKAIELNPKNMWAYMIRSGAYKALGLTRKSEDDQAKAIELGAKSP